VRLLAQVTIGVWYDVRMAIRRGLVALVLLELVVGVVFLVVSLASFDPMPMDYVPTAGLIKQHGGVQPFLQGAQDVQGVYGNHDVDSLVFTYRTQIAAPAEFWQRVDEAGEQAGWTPLTETGDVRRYERAYATRLLSSAEAARVALDPKSGVVAVGWLQWDGVAPDASFTDTRGAAWAEEVIWPKFRDSLDGRE
jgi:hypothetical protein